MRQLLLANGNRITYYLDGPKAGDSPTPLLLLHGFCEDSSVWADFIPALPAIAALPSPSAMAGRSDGGLLSGLSVIRVDLPGFGGSDVPAAPDLEVYAEAVCTVLNELDVSRCTLVGHSMGGYAALAFAEKFPERLAALGLFHSHAWADSAETKEKRQRGIDMLNAGKKDLYVAQLFPGLFAPAYAEAHPEVLDRLIKRGQQQPTAGIIAGLQAMMDRPERAGVLRQLACPLLYLLGSEDSLIKPAWALDATAPLAEIHVLDGIGHMGMFEAREKAAEIVRDFAGQ